MKPQELPPEDLPVAQVVTGQTDGPEAAVVEVAEPDLLEPDPKFWEHYSPHHEFPISWLVAIAIYAFMGILAICILLLVGSSNNTDPVLITTLDIDEGDAGGGGDNGQNSESNAKKQLDVDLNIPDIKKPPMIEKQPEVKIDPNIPQVTIPDPTQIQPTEDKIADVQADLETQLLRSVKVSKGSGGGEGGGQGTGVGTGKGEGTGGGNERTRRLKRWTVNYQISGPEDSIRKLETIGCQVAIEIPGTGSEVMLISDLRTRPVEMVRTKVSTINKLWWNFGKDKSTDTARDLAYVLGLKEVPKSVIAFLPLKFEEELLQKELEYANRTTRGRVKEESKILETIYEMNFIGNQYSLRVNSQKYK